MRTRANCLRGLHLLLCLAITALACGGRPAVTHPALSPTPQLTSPMKPTTTATVMRASPTPTATTTPAESPTQAARRLMQAIPFEIESHTMVPTTYFEDAPPPTWVTSEDLSADEWEARMGAWLEGYLGRKFPGDPDRQREVLGLFIDAHSKARVPDARLRAALLTYAGGFAEPFVDYVLNGQRPDGQYYLSHGLLFRGFDDATQGGALIVQTETGEAYIGINHNFRFEDPRVLAAILIFELAHFAEAPGELAPSAPGNGTYEELMGAWLRGQYWAREIAADPAAAGDPDAPSNSVGQVLMNAAAVLVINADGLFSTKGQPIIPGGSYDWMRYTDGFNLADRRETTTPPVLGQVLANLAMPGAPLPPADRFTLALLAWVDQFVDDAIPEMVTAARVLTLAVPESTAEVADPETLLAKRPFTPLDPPLFLPNIYVGPEALPADGPEPDETTVASWLAEYLSVEFRGDSEAVQRGLDLFSSDATRAKIPSPSLRAALAALLGTPAEPAIDVLLHETTAAGQPLFARVDFGPLEPNAVAMVQSAGNTSDPDQLTIVFNDRHRADNPFLFVRTLAHEPLHQDVANGVYEEGLIAALDTVVYLRQLARHPELAVEGTWLARFHNTNALARLNSGLGASLGLLATNGSRPILPGSTVDFTSFWDRYRDNPTFEATPGNVLLAAYLANWDGPAGARCVNSAFDEQLLACLDQSPGALTPDELIAAARALRLDLGE